MKMGQKDKQWMQQLRHFKCLSLCEIYKIPCLGNEVMQYEELVELSSECSFSALGDWPF